MAGLKDFQKLKWYYQVLIVGVISGGLLGGFWYWYLTPIQTEIDGKKTQFQQLQTDIAKANEQMKKLAQLKKEETDLRLQLEEKKKILPSEKEVDDVFRALQRTATDSAVRILRLNNRSTIDHEVYIEWPIDMEIVGTYHTLGNFLDKIRQLPRIVNISSLRVQGRASEGEASFTSSVGATYTATMFVYREEQIASSAPAPKQAK